MRHACFAFSAAVSLSLLGACAHSTGSSDAPPPASAAATSEPVNPTSTTSQAGGKVIATFVTHDSRVSILSRAGHDDLRVVVRKSDGQLVADGISIDELQTRDPLLHAILESAVASNGKGTYLDATLDRPASREPAALRGR